eukprot:scaffold13910_cov96-Isochrysis_galbana.AAC.3
MIGPEALSLKNGVCSYVAFPPPLSRGLQHKQVERAIVGVPDTGGGHRCEGESRRARAVESVRRVGPPNGCCLRV